MLSIIISDAIHNFLDGLAISASYIASLETGIAATISCIFHEIPQELGDFGVLISSGWTKKKALLYNFFSGLTCVLGGVIAYFFSSRMNISFLLPLTAGNFIYIATSDLIPEIKKHENLSKNLIHFVFFILGILLMLLIKE